MIPVSGRPGGGRGTRNSPLLSSLPLALALLLPLLLITPAGAEKYYGCSYEGDLCETDKGEVCVEDSLFGRCQSAPFDAYQWTGLDAVELEILRLEMVRLVREGNDWVAPKTQCALTFFFFSRRFDLRYDPQFCDVRDPRNLIAVLQVVEGNMQLKQASLEEEGLEGMEGLDSLEGIPVEEEGPLDPGVSGSEEDFSPVDRETVLSNIVEELVPSFEISRDQRAEPSFEEGEDVEEDVLTPVEEEVLNAMLSQVMRGEKPDLESLSDAQLDKFISYVQMMKELLAATEGEGDMTEGQIEPPVRKNDPDAEKFLLKKDEEQIGDVNLGLDPKEHKIVKGVSSVPVKHPYHRIQGNTVFIRLSKNLQDHPEKLLQLITYLEEQLGRPRNLTFSDFNVHGNEVSFKLSSVKEAQRKPQWVQDMLEGVQMGNEAAHSAAGDDLPLVKASDVAEAVFKRKSEIQQTMDMKVISTGVGEGAEEGVAYRGDEDIVVVTLVVCGLVVAVLVGLLGVYVYRNRSHARNSIKRLAADLETQPGKTYEELCRQRMAAKGGDGRPEPSGGGVLSPAPHRLGSQAEPSPPAHITHSPRNSSSSWSEEPITNTNMDISTGHMILSYLEEYLHKGGRLDEEWAGLEQYTPEGESDVAFRDHNSDKNRRDSVVPYNHARITLQSTGGEGADYINASPIYDSDPSSPVYIVTQGPLPETVTDFWQMVWEQGSVVIVNLTMTVEDGRVLCHRYWPENGSEVYGVFEVHLVSEHIWCEDYLVRSFYLKNLRTSETRTVTQFHLLSWGEEGLPGSSKSLLEFRRKVNKSYRGRSCPIVIHCSDGAGRSGTYTLLDMVLNRINKGVKEINIAGTLEHLRDQRMKVVRSKDQYELVLTCVAEEVQAILKALPQ